MKNEIFISEASLDFHEFEKLDPYLIEKILTEFIEDQHASGKNQVLIITGKGKVVRPLVEKLLPKNNLVKEFKRAGYFNGQEGAFEVELVD